MASIKMEDLEKAETSSSKDCYSASEVDLDDSSDGYGALELDALEEDDFEFGSSASGSFVERLKKAVSRCSHLDCDSGVGPFS